MYLHENDQPDSPVTVTLLDISNSFFYCAEDILKKSPDHGQLTYFYVVKYVVGFSKFVLIERI